MPYYEKILIREAYKYARIQYVIMEKTGDFGRRGKRNHEDFCRHNLLNLPVRSSFRQSSGTVSPELYADNRNDVHLSHTDRLLDAIENPEFVLWNISSAKAWDM
ncbi:MAG: hypothetical protein R2941_10975 [Desulfobacterales bacterium]